MKPALFPCSLRALCALRVSNRWIRVEGKTVTPGSNWLKTRSSPVLRVPSTLIPEESNYLLNPEHPRAKEIETGNPRTFPFDPRFLNPASRKR